LVDRQRRLPDGPRLSVVIRPDRDSTGPLWLAAPRFATRGGGPGAQNPVGRPRQQIETALPVRKRISKLQQNSLTLMILSER
jgi:hypothetical protein